MKTQYIGREPFRAIQHNIKHYTFNPICTGIFFLQKKSSDDLCLNFFIFPNLCCGCPYEFSPDFSFTSSHNTFGTPVQKVSRSFLLFIKINPTNPSWNDFWIFLNSWDFWDPIKPCEVKLCINPLEHGGGALYTSPPPLSFCLLLKIIMRHAYLKILDLANLFVADAPMKKKNQEI